VFRRDPPCFAVLFFIHFALFNPLSPRRFLLLSCTLQFITFMTALPARRSAPVAPIFRSKCKFRRCALRKSRSINRGTNGRFSRKCDVPYSFRRSVKRISKREIPSFRVLTICNSTLSVSSIYDYPRYPYDFLHRYLRASLNLHRDSRDQ